MVRSLVAGVTLLVLVSMATLDLVCGGQERGKDSRLTHTHFAHNQHYTPQTGGVRRTTFQKTPRNDIREKNHYSVQISGAEFSDVNHRDENKLAVRIPDSVQVGRSADEECNDIKCNHYNNDKTRPSDVTLESPEDHEEPYTLTYTEYPNTLTHPEDPDTLTHTENPDTFKHTEDPDTFKHTEEPDILTHIENPDTHTHTEDSGTLAHTEDSGTLTHTKGPDALTHTEDPDALSHTGDPETLTHTEGPVVFTHSGLIRGLTVDKAHVFYGIPYAAPPVGLKRWAAPEPASQWTKPYNATFPRPACMQACVGEFSEECPHKVILSTLIE